MRRRPGVTSAMVLAVALAAACGSDNPPAGSEKVAEASSVGDCLRADPDRSGGYLQASCEGGQATVEIVDVSEGGGTAPRCPAGTDVVVDAAAGPVSGGKIEGGPAVWCLRNLEAPHPGDAGMGGGELVAGDCFVLDEGGVVVTEVPCEGGATPADYRLLATVSRSEDCPATGAEPIELERPRLTVLCAASLTEGDGAGPSD